MTGLEIGYAVLGFASALATVLVCGLIAWRVLRGPRP